MISLPEVLAYWLQVISKIYDTSLEHKANCDHSLSASIILLHTIGEVTWLSVPNYNKTGMSFSWVSSMLYAVYIHNVNEHLEMYHNESAHTRKK